MHLLGGCTNEKCAPDANSLEEGGAIYFQLVDARTGRNLLASLPGAGPRYRADSVMVFDQQGRPQFVGPVNISGEIGFLPFEADLSTLPYHSQIRRRFRLYLSYADQDTIDVNFTLAKNDCGFSEYKNIIVYYNSRFVYEGSGVIQLPSMIFRKN